MEVICHTEHAHISTDAQQLLVVAELTPHALSAAGLDARSVAAELRPEAPPSGDEHTSASPPPMRASSRSGSPDRAEASPRPAAAGDEARAPSPRAPPPGEAPPPTSHPSQDACLLEQCGLGWRVRSPHPRRSPWTVVAQRVRLSVEVSDGVQVERIWNVRAGQAVPSACAPSAPCEASLDDVHGGASLRVPILLQLAAVQPPTPPAEDPSMHPPNGGAERGGASDEAGPPLLSVTVRVHYFDAVGTCAADCEAEVQVQRLPHAQLGARQREHAREAGAAAAHSAALVHAERARLSSEDGLERAAAEANAANLPGARAILLAVLERLGEHSRGGEAEAAAAHALAAAVRASLARLRPHDARDGAVRHAGPATAAPCSDKDREREVLSAGALDVRPSAGLTGGSLTPPPASAAFGNGAASPELATLGSAALSGGALLGRQGGAHVSPPAQGHGFDLRAPLKPRTFSLPSFGATSPGAAGSGGSGSAGGAAAAAGGGGGGGGGAAGGPKSHGGTEGGGSAASSLAGVFGLSAFDGGARAAGADRGADGAGQLGVAGAALGVGRGLAGGGGGGASGSAASLTRQWQWRRRSVPRDAGEQPRSSLGAPMLGLARGLTVTGSAGGGAGGPAAAHAHAEGLPVDGLEGLGVGGHGHAPAPPLALGPRLTSSASLRLLRGRGRGPPPLLMPLHTAQAHAASLPPGAAGPSAVGGLAITQPLPPMGGGGLTGTSASRAPTPGKPSLEEWLCRLLRRPVPASLPDDVVWHILSFLQPAHAFSEALASPTHIVDRAASVRGTFTTISAALRAASHGDRIIVRPGIYRESLRVDVCVAIIAMNGAGVSVGAGAGAAAPGASGGAVLTSARNHTLQCTAPLARVEGMTLRQTGSSGRSCVLTPRGQLEVCACDVSSASGLCVEVTDRALPTIRYSRVHDGAAAGLWFRTGSGGIVDGNEIMGNGWSGVQISEGSNPTLVRNFIHDNKSAGVISFNGGRGVATHNDISTNGKGGVQVRSGASPELRTNRIFDERSFGIWVYERGLGHFEDNEIVDNAWSGFQVEEGSAPTVIANRLSGNRSAGIVVYNRGSGVYEWNDISANGRCGVQIKSGSAPCFRYNRIHHEKQAGVLTAEDGTGTLEDNDIFDNQWSGVQTEGPSDPLLRRNRIHHNGGAGFIAYQNGSGRLERNHIYDNKKYGVQSKTGGHPTVRANRIHDKTYGIYLTESGAGVFENNTIHSLGAARQGGGGGAGAGIYVSADCSPVLNNNEGA